MSLAEMRRAKGMLQRHVAEKMGVSKERISQIENGFPYLHFNVVRDYLEALGACVTVTLDDGSQARPQQAGDYSRAVLNRDRGDRTAFKERNLGKAQAAS